MRKRLAFCIISFDNAVRLVTGVLGGMFAAVMLYSFYCGAVAVSGEPSYPQVPVIMYHNILDSSSRVSEYVITPDMLEADVLYLRELGYKTVLTRDIISFCEEGVPLPEKSVILTFDDGYYNNYSYAYPILKKYGEKAVISVIAECSQEASYDNAVQNNNYSHITWEQAAEMTQSGLVEIQNHSFSMHDLSRRKGVLRERGEAAAQYRETLIRDVLKAQELIENATGVKPVAFTYPFGAVNNECHNIVKELGFKVTYGCEEGSNTITHNAECLHRLKRFNRSGKEEREVFFKRALGL